MTHAATPLHPVVRSDVAHDAAYQAYWALRLAFIVAPIVAGIDKFSHTLVNWDLYLAPWVADLFNVTPHQFMLGAGVVEIIAGIGVAVMPRVFGYIVCAWLVGIVVNLLSMPGYYDIALRDAGLALAAFALARLSHVYPARAPRAIGGERTAN